MSDGSIHGDTELSYLQAGWGVRRSMHGDTELPYLQAGWGVRRSMHGDTKLLLHMQMVGTVPAHQLCCQKAASTTRLNCGKWGSLADNRSCSWQTVSAACRTAQQQGCPAWLKHARLCRIGCWAAHQGSRVCQFATACLPLEQVGGR